MTVFSIKKISSLTLLVVVLAIFLSSCQVVKPYQKNKINDSEMNLGARKIERTTLNFQSYREGASGASGGKSGGGCGCN